MISSAHPKKYWVSKWLKDIVHATVVDFVTVDFVAMQPSKLKPS